MKWRNVETDTDNYPVPEGAFCVSHWRQGTVTISYGRQKDETAAVIAHEYTPEAGQKVARAIGKVTGLRVIDCIDGETEESLQEASRSFFLGGG